MGVSSKFLRILAATVIGWIATIGHTADQSAMENTMRSAGTDFRSVDEGHALKSDQVTAETDPRLELARQQFAAVLEEAVRVSPVAP